MGQPIQPYGIQGDSSSGGGLQIDQILIVDQNTADTSAYLTKLYNLFRGYGNNQARIKQASIIYRRIENFKSLEEREVTKLETEISELTALIEKTNNPGQEDLKMLFASITTKYQDCLAQGVGIDDLFKELDKVRVNLTNKKAGKENELKEHNRRINLYNDGMGYTANILRNNGTLPVPAGATAEKPQGPPPAVRLKTAKSRLFGAPDYVNYASEEKYTEALRKYFAALPDKKMRGERAANIYNYLADNYWKLNDKANKETDPTKRPQLLKKAEICAAGRDYCYDIFSNYGEMPKAKPGGFIADFLEEIERGDGAKKTAPNFWYNEKTKIGYRLTYSKSQNLYTIKKYVYEGKDGAGKTKWKLDSEFNYEDTDNLLFAYYEPEESLSMPASSGASKTGATAEAGKPAAIADEFLRRQENGQLTQNSDLSDKTKVWSGTFSGYDVRYELKADGTLTKLRKQSGSDGYTAMGVTRGGKLAKAYAAAPNMASGGLISYDGGKSWTNTGGASGTEIAAVGPPPRRPAKGYKTLAAVPMGELTQWKWDPIKERYRNVDELESEEMQNLQQLRYMGIAYDRGTLNHELNIADQYARIMSKCGNKPVKLALFFEQNKIVELRKEGNKLIVSLANKDGQELETIEYTPEKVKNLELADCISRKHSYAGSNTSSLEIILYSGVLNAPKTGRTLKWDAIANDWYDTTAAYTPSQESGFKKQSRGWLRHIGFNASTGLISRENPYVELNALELALNSHMSKIYVSAEKNIFLKLKQNKDGGITVTKYEGEKILETVEYAKKDFEGRTYISKKHSAAGKTALLEEKRISCAPDGTDIANEKTETAMAAYYYKGRSGLKPEEKIFADYNKFLKIYKNGIGRLALGQGIYAAIAVQGNKLIVSRFRSSDNLPMETAEFTSEVSGDNKLITKTTANNIAGGVTTERISYIHSAKEQKAALLQEQPKAEKPKPVISAETALRKECDSLLTAAEGKPIGLPDKTITINNRIYLDQDNNHIEVYGVEVSKTDGSKTKVMYDMVYDEDKKRYNITKTYYADSVRKPSKTEKFFSDGSK